MRESPALYAQSSGLCIYQFLRTGLPSLFLPQPSEAEARCDVNDSALLRFVYGPAAAVGVGLRSLKVYGPKISKDFVKKIVEVSDGDGPRKFWKSYEIFKIFFEKASIFRKFLPSNYEIFNFFHKIFSVAS